MRQPIRWDLFGDRGQSLRDTLAIFDDNLTGATFSAQVRTVPDASGSALITLTVTLLYGGTATIAAHIAAGRLNTGVYNLINPTTGVKYVNADTQVLSVIQAAVNNTNMVAPYVPLPSERGDDAVLAWDLLITPSGGLQDKWVEGEFRVRGTVTQ